MMEKTDKKHNKTLLFVLCAVLLFVIAFFLNVNTASKNFENNNVNTNLNISNNVEKTDKSIVSEENKRNKTIFYSFNKDNKKSTVFSELLNYCEKNNIEIKYNNNYSFGVFVDSIDGIKNGDNGKYWQYYVNGVLGDVAADKKVLKEGDNVKWIFEEVPF